MKRSVDRILTTHTGSLIRPPQLLELVKARQAGQQIDQRAYEATLKDAVRDVVARQVEAGIDIPTTASSASPRAGRSMSSSGSAASSCGR